MNKQYYIYILSNNSKTLYAGITNNLKRRIYEHKNKLISGFTSKYNITQLVYYEIFDDPGSAIAREKAIKGWIRNKKIELIQSFNPEWNDLYDGI